MVAMDLNIVYEDNHLIVVEKPSGVLTQPANLNLPVLLDEVKKYIKIKYNKPGDVYLGLLHRLDTNVSGIVCFAKTSKAAARVSKEIRELRFEKKYLTVVKGIINTYEETELVDYILKDLKDNKAVITNELNGKKSILRFRKIDEINNKTLLEVNLITGRFHQIRAQLANFGTPIYGDSKYGSFKQTNKLALYAYSLKFKHPVKDEIIEIKNYPQDNIFKDFNLINKLPYKWINPFSKKVINRFSIYYFIDFFIAF